MIEPILMSYIYILNLVTIHKMSQNIKDELKKSQSHIFQKALACFFCQSATNVMVHPNQPNVFHKTFDQNTYDLEPQ